MPPLRLLITAGPTREPIDAVRYISNRSSGRIGAALATAATRVSHHVTLILGPVSIPMPQNIRRIDVETAAQMREAVLREFPAHDILIMAAAIADYRPIKVQPGKLARQGSLTIECEPTDDIIAAAGKIKRPDQRTIGFSLESPGDSATASPTAIDRATDRAREKMLRKSLDLIVYNPTQTMDSPSIESILLYPDGRRENL